MPVVNSAPTAGMAEAYSRATPVVVSTTGNALSSTREAPQAVPAGAGPAAVVTVSQAAQKLSAALENTGAGSMPKPGINNGTMAHEGGDADALRSLLAERYDAQAARLNEEPA